MGMKSIQPCGSLILYKQVQRVTLTKEFFSKKPTSTDPIESLIYGDRSSLTISGIVFSASLCPYLIWRGTCGMQATWIPTIFHFARMLRTQLFFHRTLIHHMLYYLGNNLVSINNLIYHCLRAWFKPYKLLLSLHTISFFLGTTYPCRWCM